MPCLRMGTLGSLQITVDNAPTPSLGSDKARALLLYLTVEADRPHRREELIGLLWPNVPEETARHNLRQTLFSIRRAIADHTARPPYLVITREEIQFNTVSEHWLDVAAFNALLAACQAHPHPELNTCDECAVRMQSAVELYRGKFLQQFFLEDSAEFEEWALLQRETLHRRALDTLEHLTAYHERRAEYERARRYASRQLELDPWHETAHRQMMRVLALNGERGAALHQYDTCRRILADELGVEPSEETRELHAQINRGEFPQRRELPPVQSPPLHPLPVQLTPFIGREREMAELGRLVADPQCRLITLTGPGGIGKTRLAIQVAARHREMFAHRAAFVPLASACCAESIVPAIADAVGLVLSRSSDPRLQIRHYIGDKEMLLVLDSMEHLLDGAELLIELLQHAPGVKLLCTSLEVLHLPGEWVFQVEGLDVPEDARTADLTYGAIALFVQHARRAQVGYVLTDEERIGVTRIGHLVGGMPLGLELAANWVRVLSSQEIADQIERNVDFLTGSTRRLPERHRGLRAVFDQSWRMLTVGEQRALSQLSVFRGGFQRHAAEQIAEASLSALASLVSKSLVRRMESDRYDLHELVRHYASRQLTTDPTQDAVTHDRHGEYFLDLVKQQQDRLFSARQKEALATLATDIANIRLAIDWIIDRHQTARLRQVSFALLHFYEYQGWYVEGASVFRQAADRLQRPEAESVAETGRQIALLEMQTNEAYFTRRLGKPAEAYATHRRITDELRGLGDQTALRYSLRCQGLAAIALGRLVEAETCLRQDLELSQAAERPWEVGIGYAYLGYVARAQGALADAQQYYRQGLAISREVGDPRLINFNLAGLGFVLLLLDQPVQAKELLEEALSLAEETGDRYDLGITCGLLGQAAKALGETAKARALFEKSIALLKEIGDVMNLPGAYVRLGYLTESQREIPQAEDLFRTAARIATETQDVLSLLDALTGLATVRAETGARESALELATFVLEQPSCHASAKSRAERLRVEIEAQFTPEQVHAIKNRARAKTLEMIARESLTAPAQ